ncbi:MAG TPA: hypothetical protein VGB99_08240 [Acidobacteriota bacterium]
MRGILIAGAAAGFVAVVLDWLINAWLFHDYQKRTPSTWRAEGPKQYLLSMAATFGSGFTYAIFYAWTGGVHLGGELHWLAAGLLFGLGCWMALALPIVLSLAIFVNLHRGCVVGLLLDWLLISLAAGAICSRFL